MSEETFSPTRIVSQPKLSQDESEAFRKMLSAMVMTRISNNTMRKMMSNCIDSDQPVTSLDELRKAVDGYRPPIENQLISWVMDRVKDLDNKAERGY